MIPPHNLHDFDKFIIFCRRKWYYKLMPRAVYWLAGKTASDFGLGCNPEITPIRTHTIGMNTPIVEIILSMSCLFSL